MCKAYCLMNHELTRKQIDELEKRFFACEIVCPEKSLAERWGQVPALPELDMVLIGDVVRWLSSAAEGDLLLVQGEVGSTFMIVDYGLKRGLIPLHAVTRRVSAEVREGETVRKTNVFEHACFRKYEFYHGEKIFSRQQESLVQGDC